MVLKKGKPARSGKVKSIGQLRVEDSAGIDFGVGVDYGTDDDDATLHDGGNFAGVAMTDENKGYTRDSDGNPQKVDKYYQGDPVEVARKGPVYVPYDPIEGGTTSVNKGDSVYVIPSGNKDAKQGYFTGNAGYTAIEAEFAESGTGLSLGDLLAIELDLPKGA